MMMSIEWNTLFFFSHICLELPVIAFQLFFFFPPSQFYSIVCRVATILKTRYTAPGFWNAGLGLFIETESLVSESSEREHLRSCIAEAHQQLEHNQSEGAIASNSSRGQSA